ncbi:MAG: PEP-CTERM sorting domain-containing protein [Microcoleaceae cyanobacterium]
MKRIWQIALTIPVSLATPVFMTLPTDAATFATQVEYYQEGAGIVDAYRRETDHALGAPQADKTEDFLSLGLGGWAIFGFDTLFSKQVTLWETTWGQKKNQNAYDEQVQVYVGSDLDFTPGNLAETLGNGNWLDLGIVKNIADGAYDTDQNNDSAESGATLNIGNNAPYQYVLLVDQSENSLGRDGFDVNAIAVTSERGVGVPEPSNTISLITLGIFAAGLLLKRTPSQS